MNTNNFTDIELKILKDLLTQVQVLVEMNIDDESVDSIDEQVQLIGVKLRQSNSIAKKLGLC